LNDIYIPTAAILQRSERNVIGNIAAINSTETKTIRFDKVFVLMIYWCKSSYND